MHGEYTWSDTKREREIERGPQRIMSNCSSLLEKIELPEANSVATSCTDLKVKGHQSLPQSK